MQLAGTEQNRLNKVPGCRDTVSSAIASHADLAGLSKPDFGLLSDACGSSLPRQLI